MMSGDELYDDDVTSGVLDPPPWPRDPTCAERLPAHLESRLADIRTMLGRDDPEDAPDDIDQPGPLSEYPLGLSVGYAVTVELSTGGPADYLTADVAPDGTVTRAAYHFADWWDHAEQQLSGDDLDTVERFIGALFGDPLDESLALAVSRVQ